MRSLLLSLNYGAWALPALLVIPLVGAILIRLLGRSALPGRPLGVAKWREVRILTVAALALEALVALGLWWFVEPGVDGFQARVSAPWIPDWGARFTLGVDGISMVMILLTTLLMPLAVVGSWTSVKVKVRTYYALLLVLTTGLIGVFTAVDLLLFYVFWELMLIPIYFIIGIWGGKMGTRANLKYFMFTMAGSLLMLVAIVAVWQAAGGETFDLVELQARHGLGLGGQLWLFGAFFLAFAIKTAVFPFHTWLPDAQHESPTTTAVALALKVGAYGIIRFAIPLFPAAATDYTVRTVIVSIAVVAIVYGALVALVQPDFKRLVSYASISHAGFIILGIFAFSVESVNGAVMMMVNTGITTGALFLLLGMLHERRRTGMIANFGGLARVVPMFAAMLTLVSMSSIGLPGTNGFVGEFLVLIGSYRTEPVATVIAASGVVLGAIYFLWAIQRVIFNPLTNPKNARLRDLNRRELSVMAAFAVAIIWLGVAPGGLLSRVEGASSRLVRTAEQGAAGVGLAAGR